MITIGNFSETLKRGGEAIGEDELNMIFEELAGQTKRQSLDPEKKYERCMGITFNDFMVMMLPK